MTDPRDDAARRVWIQMSALVLDNERRKRVSDELEMSFARIRALRRIADLARPMGELAQALGVDPPYLTLIVDDLETRGLVERREHPSDRRTKVVGATPRGQELARRAEEILDEPPHALQELSNGELETLAQLLGTVIAHDDGERAAFKAILN